MTIARYEIVFTATAEVEPGPLSRFCALAEQLETEGLEVPPEIAAVLADLTHTRSDTP